MQPFSFSPEIQFCHRSRHTSLKHFFLCSFSAHAPPHLSFPSLSSFPVHYLSSTFLFFTPFTEVVAWLSKWVQEWRQQWHGGRKAHLSCRAIPKIQDVDRKQRNNCFIFLPLLPKLLLVLLVATCSLFDFQASSNGLNGLLPDWVDGCTKCVPLSYT